MGRMTTEDAAADGRAKRPYRVLVADGIDQRGVEILSAVAEVEERGKMAEEELSAAIGDYDALMVRSATKVTEKVIAAGAKRLKIVGRAGVGVDNINVSCATKNGIFVVNSPQGNTVAAAEHTLAMMLSVARHIPQADASLRNLEWRRADFMGTQLQLKTLGIVGLGQVGGHVARVASEMGMKLLCYDPFVNAQKAAALNCTVCTLEQLLRESDFVTLHVPLAEGTRHMINAQRLKTMKPTAHIINVSRGGIVDEVALCEALKSKTIAGAALDVFEEEKVFPADSPLLKAPNLILTPHLGASTTEAQVNVAVDVAEQIKATLSGNLPQSAVNLPGMRPSEMDRLYPLLKCGTVLGRLAAHSLEGAVEELEVTMEGEFAKEKGEPVLLSAANGILAIHSEHRVNFVNVQQLAEEHKISMRVVKDSSHRKAAVCVRVSNRSSSVCARGTVTDDKQILLKEFYGAPMYLPLPDPQDEGESCSMLYSYHDDTPGTLALITTVIGEEGGNIAQCHLGQRVEEDGTKMGMCVFRLASPLPETLIPRLSALKPVKDCRACWLPLNQSPPRSESVSPHNPSDSPEASSPTSSDVVTSTA